MADGSSTTRVQPHVHPGELGAWEDDRARGADLAHDRHGGKVHGAYQHVLRHRRHRRSRRVGRLRVMGSGHAKHNHVAGALLLLVDPGQVRRHAHHGVSVDLVVHVHGREGGAS